MYRFDYIIDNLRKYKHTFIRNITKDVVIPKQKFLKQAIPAVLLSGSLVITRHSKWIRDNCKDVHHSKKRLLNQLNNKAHVTVCCHMGIFWLILLFIMKL